MFESLMQSLHEATEIRNFTLVSLLHMVIRGVIIYAFGIVLIRCNRKLFGVNSTFNRILVVMLGSLLADAVVSAEHFLIGIATVLLLTVLNGIMNRASFHMPAIESLIKGDQPIILKDGQIQWQTMKKHFITERELMSELCTQLHTQDLTTIEIAKIASDGRIKFIKRYTNV